MIINLATERAFKRWARSDFYSYIRVISARYFDPDAPADKVMYVVQCEYRNLSHVRVQEHGYDFDEVVRRVDVQMPERPAGYVVEKPGYSWLAPSTGPIRRIVVRKSSTPSMAYRTAVQRRRRMG